MARLPKGTKPTPAKERMKLYREELEKAGGRRMTFDLPPDAADALETIIQRDGCTAKEAVTTALVNETKRKKH